MKTTLLLITLMLATTTAHAQVNKCEINGQVTYQSAPCPQEAAAVELIPAERRRPEPQARPTAPATPAARSDGIDGIPAKEHAQIRALCTDEWGNNFRMRNHCYESHRDAWQELNRLIVARRGNETSDDVLLSCMQQWRKSNSEHGFNWRMVNHCYNQQMSAARNW